MSSSSGGKRKLYEADLISILPEHLLVAIISMLPLKMAVQTSVLSRKWRYLWKYTHSIVLKVDWDFIKRIDVNSSEEATRFFRKLVSEFLVAKLKMLQIEFVLFPEYHGLMGQLVDFGIERGVEKLYLAFSPFTRYRLPQSLFTAITLTKLKLTFCEIELPASICLSSLRTLRFEFCRFNDFAFQSLVSNCVALEKLGIYHSVFSELLVFDASNTSLKTLKIRTSYSFQKYKIATPSLELLEIGGCGSVSVRSTKNLVSLCTLRLILKSNADFDNSWNILKDLRHVNNVEFDLELSQWDYLHNLKKNSLKWQHMEATHLKLLSYSENAAFYVSTCLLLPYYPYLENLEIVVKDAYDFYFGKETECWKRLQFSFSSLLPQLRTVIIHVPLLTAKDSDSEETADSTETPLWYSRNQLKLIRVLLATSKNLEKLVVVGEWLDDEFYGGLKHELLGLDKASAAAEIVIKGEKNEFKQSKWSLTRTDYDADFYHGLRLL